MTLESLKLQNFKRYKSYEIEFETGLCGILGRNGSGKSTIFEAVFFALYGEFKGQKELLPTAKSEGAVKVELSFSINEKSFIVSREFRGKNQTAYASLKEGDVPLANGAKEVSIAISKLIGMGKEAFLHTVFASQKELTALSSMKNEERKAMMRRLLGLEKIDSIEEMLREELRELGRDIKAANAYLLSEDATKKLRDELTLKTAALKEEEATIKVLKEESAKLKTAYENAKLAVESEQKAKEARAKKSEALDKAKHTLELHEKQLSQQSEELKTLQTKEAHYAKHLPLKEKLDMLEKSLLVQDAQKTKQLKKEGLEKEQEQLRIEYVSRKAEVAQLTQEIAPQETLQKELTLQKKGISELKTANDQCTQEINKLNAEITTNNSKISDLQKKIETLIKLGSDSPCPICTRALLEQYDAVISALQGEITSTYQKNIDAASRLLDVKKKEITLLQKQLAEAESKASETDKHIALLVSKSKDLAKAQELFVEVERRGVANKESIKALGIIAYDEALYTKTIKERDLLKPQVEELIKLEALISTIPDKTKALQSMEAQIKNDKALVESALATLKQDNYDEKVHQNISENAKKAEALKDENLAKCQKVALAHAGIQKELESIQKELKRDEDQRIALKTKETDKNDYKKLKILIAQFKTHINAKVAPRISEIASEMYARITRGRYGHIEVTSEFDFYIYDEGSRYPIERYSGGEIDLANLVLRIAVSKTLGELSGGGNIGFLAFDEVFGSQDEERRFRIMEAFNTISESYRQIFLISHESEIKEMFERVVEL